jgi:hypothetical protein
MTLGRALNFLGFTFLTLLHQVDSDVSGYGGVFLVCVCVCVSHA